MPVRRDRWKRRDDSSRGGRWYLTEFSLRRSLTLFSPRRERGPFGRAPMVLRVLSPGEGTLVRTRRTAGFSLPVVEQGWGPGRVLGDNGAMDSQTPYARLDPATVLDAVEAAGHVTNGRLLALNSYENRVYQVGLEEARPLVAKFYRPGRWTDAQILEEHGFALEAAAAEIPVVAPLRHEGETLLEHAGYRYALYPLKGGHWPELGTEDEQRMMGRFLGRLHALGAARPFRHRLALSIQRMGQASRDWLLEQGWIPAHLESAYDSLTAGLMPAIEHRFELAGPFSVLRIHGDCHPGNILWTDDGPHFVDLDDCVTGPAVQDLWMLLSGSRDQVRLQLTRILEGYGDFRDFDLRELWLVEALRTLRIMHYAAWIARRWDDPAFPMAFPWFMETKFWEEHVLALREQAALLQEEPVRP